MNFPARVARRLERAILGALMSMIALLIERRVLKAIRRADNEQLRPASQDGYGG